MPERVEGDTLDLGCFSSLHEDGHQLGALAGYTRKGLKACQRPIVAALAEVPLVDRVPLTPEPNRDAVAALAGPYQRILPSIA